MELNYPTHFLHDITTMTPEQRDGRAVELIAWCKRFAEGNANPKWVKYHMFELSRLLEMSRERDRECNCVEAHEPGCRFSL